MKDLQAAAWANPLARAAIPTGPQMKRLGLWSIALSVNK